MSEYFKEIEKLNKDDLLSQKTAEELFCIDEAERKIIQSHLCDRAKELKCATEFKEFIKAYKRSIKEANKITSYVEVNPLYSALDLELTDKGQVKNTIGNFEKILRNENDAFLGKLKFNELSQKMEFVTTSKTEPFTDETLSMIRSYIQKEYHILDRKNLNDALNTVIKERKYHPIKEKIESIKWDKTSRIEQFLHVTMVCEDNEYTREASRLIFAGGIHRLYNPGCKFDDVIVLIGLKQGEGKSTLVRWIALYDDYYRTITTIKGKQAMENLFGAWICEIPELTALKEVNDAEAKDFLSRQKDTFRKPYDIFAEDYKRQCIFIGTTNNRQFLTDITGNRRYYPVVVHRNGYTLFENESDVKHFIEQCWAEALDRYNRNELPPFANPDIISSIREHQEAALEDDWRIGAIKEYLKDKNIVCGKLIWDKGLQMSHYVEYKQKQSREVSAIMQNFEEWKYQGNKKHDFGQDIGEQRYWEKEIKIPY